MIDIHSHVLPNIDDGASTLFESLELLRIAADNGTKKMVLTPHLYNPRIGYVDINKILTAFEKYKQQAADIGIELLLGSEVFCGNLFLKEIGEKKFLTINNTEYILVEFDFDDDIDRVLSAIDKITRAGYRPIVAHPERYHFLRRHPFAVPHMIAKGALLQINATDFSKKVGFETYEFAMWLLHKEYVSFVASDAHDMQYRTTDMQSAFMHVYSEISKKYALDLFFNNPDAVISGKNIMTGGN